MSESRLTGRPGAATSSPTWRRRRSRATDAARRRRPPHRRSLARRLARPAPQPGLHRSLGLIILFLIVVALFPGLFAAEDPPLRPAEQPRPGRRPGIRSASTCRAATSTRASSTGPGRRSPSACWPRCRRARSAGPRAGSPASSAAGWDSSCPASPTSSSRSRSCSAASSCCGGHQRHRLAGRIGMVPARLAADRPYRPRLGDHRPSRTTTSRRPARWAPPTPGSCSATSLRTRSPPVIVVATIALGTYIALRRPCPTSASA